MEPVRRGASDTTRRPGGRTARAGAGIVPAVTRLLSEVGYSNLTMDAIAKAAQVHRATLYRRWPSKEALVGDVLLAEADRVIPLPDTGMLESDLKLLVSSVTSNLTGDGEALVRTMVGEASRVPEVRRANHAIWKYRLGLASELVQRGIDRGELPKTVDPDLFVEELVAPIFFRVLVTGRPLDDDYGNHRVAQHLKLTRQQPAYVHATSKPERKVPQ